MIKITIRKRSANRNKTVIMTIKPKSFGVNNLAQIIVITKPIPREEIFSENDQNIPEIVFFF